MPAAATDPGAASGVLAPPSCGVPSGTPRRSSLRLPLSLPGSFASLAMIYPDGLLPRAETCAQGEPAPGQELRDGEPASPLELDLEQAERPRARRDHEPIRPGRDHLAGARGAGRERGAMDLEELPLQRGERRRRRGQRTYLALELDRRAAPVETALLALDARREGDARGGPRDRTQRAGLEAVDRLADGLRTETCEPLAERAAGVVGRDRRLALEEDVARVHLLGHRHDGDAGHGITRENGPRDRRRAAVARQERGVDVDAPAGRQVEDGARQDLPVGGGHDEAGGGGAERG